MFTVHLPLLYVLRSAQRNKIWLMRRTQVCMKLKLISQQCNYGEACVCVTQVWQIIGATISVEFTSRVLRPKNRSRSGHMWHVISVYARQVHVREVRKHVIRIVKAESLEKTNFCSVKLRRCTD